MSEGARTLDARPLRRFKPYPAYKDSGVEWLGEIPAHWEVKRLKRVFRVVNGSTPASGEPSFWDGDIPWVTPDDLGDLEVSTITSTRRNITEAGYRSCGTTIVPAGSLVLSTRAPIGHLAIAGVDLCTNQGCRSLVFRNATSREFFFYQLFAARPELESLGQGSTFRELAKGTLEDFDLTDAPAPEQRAIAAFLDRETARIDALVAKKERLIELLQEKRTAVITAVVTGKMEVVRDGGEHKDEGGRRKDENSAFSLHPSAFQTSFRLQPSSLPMKDSGVEWLGEIPAHWEVKRLKEVVPAITVGIVVTPSKYYVDDGIPCLRSLNITTGAIRMTDIVYISSAANELHRKSKIYAGDIVVVGTGKAGAAVVVPPELDGANCIDLLIIRRSKETDSHFLYHFVNSPATSGQVEAHSVGAIQEHYNTGTLAQLRIPRMPIWEQRAIAAFLDRETAKIDALIAKVREAIDRVKELRTALISAAVTGKIDVREPVDGPQVTL